MSAPLYQVAISKDDEAVTSLYDAEMVLVALGVKHDLIETDGAGGEAAGVFLVGLTGPEAPRAAAGEEFSIAEYGLQMEVPQP